MVQSMNEQQHMMAETAKFQAEQVKLQEEALNQRAQALLNNKRADWLPHISLLASVVALSVALLNAYIK